MQSPACMPMCYLYDLPRACIPLPSAVDEEVSRLRARSAADAETHAHEQTQLRFRLEAERKAQAESGREGIARVEAELSATRQELSSKLAQEVKPMPRASDCEDGSNARPPEPSSRCCWWMMMIVDDLSRTPIRAAAGIPRADERPPVCRSCAIAILAPDVVASDVVA